MFLTYHGDMSRMFKTVESILFVTVGDCLNEGYHLTLDLFR